jgi:hypothetical protein
MKYYRLINIIILLIELNGHLIHIIYWQVQKINQQNCLILDQQHVKYSHGKIVMRYQQWLVIHIYIICLQLEMVRVVLVIIIVVNKRLCVGLIGVSRHKYLIVSGVGRGMLCVYWLMIRNWIFMLEMNSKDMICL